MTVAMLDDTYSRPYTLYSGGPARPLGYAATRLVTGARKFDRITPVMRELHWLLVRLRIRFKTAVLVFKCLHGLAPEYLSEYCKLTTGRSHLRSANACLLSVPRTRTTYGDRSFAVSGPVARNSLRAFK